MGSTGPRMFVPPQTDPLNEEVHSLVFRQADVLGTNMSFRSGRGRQDRGRPQHDLRQLLARRHPQHRVVEKRHRSADRGRERSHRQPHLHRPGRAPRRRQGHSPSTDAARTSRRPGRVVGGACATSSSTSWLPPGPFSKPMPKTARRFSATSTRMARWSIDNGLTEPPYAFVIPPDQHDPVAAAKLVDLSDRARGRGGAGLRSPRSRLLGLPCRHDGDPGGAAVPAVSLDHAAVATLPGGQERDRCRDPRALRRGLVVPSAVHGRRGRRSL